MAKYLVGCDNIDGKETTYINQAVQFITQNGHEAEALPVGPNVVQSRGGSPSSKGTIGIQIVGGMGLGTPTDMATGVKNGYYHYDSFISLGSYEFTHNSLLKTAMMDTPVDSCEPGMNASQCDQYRGLTPNQWNQKFAPYAMVIYRDTFQEALAAIFGGNITSTSSTTEGGVSVTKIPDVSFFGVINQICGAVDALFIIANNMAFLLSFSDYYKYRDKYDSDMPKIEASDVIANSLEKDWAVDGFYNAVNVKYKSGELNYQYDALVEKYGENVFHYELPEDDRETAKAKAKALLSAHVRDYSIDLHLQCLYNHKITVGSWVKVRTTLSEVNQNIDVEENSNNIVQTEELSSEKYLTTTEKGYEVFFVQGYNIKWGYEKALIMDLHLKYGPDTPQDPINATYTTGAVQSSTGGAGGYGSDCFSGDEICPANSTKIMGHYSGSNGTSQCKSLMNSKYLPTQKEYAPRAMQGSSYDQQLSGKTPAEAFLYFQNTSQYCYYADFCKLSGDTNSGGDCCNILWDAVLSKQIRGMNCGDSMRMLKVFFDCTGTPACGVHIDDHYFNAVQINGTWEIIDGTRPSGNNTTGFPGGSSYTFAGEHDKSCSPCAF